VGTVCSGGQRVDLRNLSKESDKGRKMRKKILNQLLPIAFQLVVSISMVKLN
jgi:hypothetical protein